MGGYLNPGNCFRLSGRNILLVGVNYDKATREHTCMIEEAEK
mgnify:CR=1 FL=1